MLFKFKAKKLQSNVLSINIKYNYFTLNNCSQRSSVLHSYVFAMFDLVKIIIDDPPTVLSWAAHPNPLTSLSNQTFPATYVGVV